MGPTFFKCFLLDKQFQTVGELTQNAFADKANDKCKRVQRVHISCSQQLL